jgi:hypothetical protein
MSKIPFNEAELNVVRVEPSRYGAPIPIFDFPISMKENHKRFFGKNPVWYPLGIETGLFCPAVFPDNAARAFVIEANMVPPQEGVLVEDMFGVKWEYVAIAGGSMVRPGDHMLSNVNDWESVIKFPDIDSWDWAGSAAANKEFLNNGKFNSAWMINGWWFERLVSFMGFEAAAMALVDEDQEDALKALFEATTDLGCRLVDKFVEYYDNIDIITVHDDWGSQRSPFFSEDTAMEMIVPYMKKLVDHIHSKGLIADLHSCGHISKRINCIVEAGWDSWTPQAMNDTWNLFENHGDKIVISIIPEQFDPAVASEEDQRRAAREYFEKVNVPGKFSSVSLYGGSVMTNAFREELYKISRNAYSK